MLADDAVFLFCLDEWRLPASHQLAGSQVLQPAEGTAESLQACAGLQELVQRRLGEAKEGATPTTRV